MKIQTIVNSDYQTYEQILITIVRTLPPNRVEQLVDFARFLDAQRLTEQLAQTESRAEIEADNAHWDALLSTDSGQTLLEKLAGEALAEYRAGNTRPMTFNDNGRIIPE